jgi:dolichyl-phosphate beta-glucosyltransferase
VTTLSVVIPVLNEERAIAEALRRVAAYLSLKNYRWEILVSNDGSTDRTRRIVEAFAQSRPSCPVRLLNSTPNHGKGFAARQGVQASAGRFILLTDADLSSPIKEVDKLMAALERGADVAIGSRALRAKGCDVRQSPKRWLAGRVFNALVRLAVLPGIRDSQCGFKLFTDEAAKKLFSVQKLDGFSFDVEVLYLARRLGLRIAEVPVMWSEGRDSKVRLLRDSAQMARDLFRIKRLHT